MPVLRVRRQHRPVVAVTISQGIQVTRLRHCLQAVNAQLICGIELVLSLGCMVRSALSHRPDRRPEGPDAPLIRIDPTLRTDCLQMPGRVPLPVASWPEGAGYCSDMTRQQPAATGSVRSRRRPENPDPGSWHAG